MSYVKNKNIYNIFGKVQTQGVFLSRWIPFLGGCVAGNPHSDLNHASVNCQMYCDVQCILRTAHCTLWSPQTGRILRSAAPHYSTTGLQCGVTSPSYYITVTHHHTTAQYHTTTLQHSTTQPHYGTVPHHHTTAHYTTAWPFTQG